MHYTQKKIQAAVSIAASMLMATAAAEPDAQAVTYTWTGSGGDGKWTTPANWSPDVTPCFGYPDNGTYAKAVFSGDAIVDLCGEEIETVGNDGKGVAVAARANVTIRNGKLKWNSNMDAGTAVGSGAILTLENVALTTQRYATSGGDTLVLRGTSSLSGSYRPWNKSSVLEVRDGATTIGKFEGYGGTYNSSRILVSNATLTVQTAAGNLSQGRPYLLQRGGKLIVKGTGTTTISSTTGFSFEGGSFEAPDGVAVNFASAKEFVVKAADYIPEQGVAKTEEFVLISSKGTLTLPDLAGRLDVTGLPEYILEAQLTREGNVLKLTMTPQGAHQHVWGEWMTTVPPTCVTEGERTHSCTAAGCTEPPATETETLDALGHDFANGVCARCGVKEKGDPDTKAITYTWKSDVAAGAWNDFDSWLCSEAPCYGIPSNTLATAAFDSDADVNLNGGEYGVKALNGESGVTVKLSNGSLKHSDALFAMKGTLELKDVDFAFNGNPEFRQNHTVVLEGHSTFSYYRPWNSTGGTLLVRNGESTIANYQGYYNGAESSANNMLMVSNAVLTLTGSYAAATGRPLVIRNGADRQGQMKITTSSVVDLRYYRYDLEIPVDGLAEPAIEVRNLGKFCSSIANVDQTARVVVDVTDYVRSKPVALVHCASTTMEVLPAVELTTIPAEAKARRNAIVYWDGNTLYYKQDGKSGLTLFVR